MVDIGFVWYEYETDKMDFSNPEAANALRETLRNAGCPVPTELKQLDPIAPERRDFISEMRIRGNYYYSLYLFADETHIIGPILVDDIERDPILYDVEAEIEASSLDLNHSIAVHGATLLQDISLPNGRNRIFNEEIVHILDRVFYPFDLKNVTAPK